MNDVPINEVSVNDVIATKQSPKFLIGFVALAVFSVGAIAVARRTSAQKIVTAAAPAAAPAAATGGATATQPAGAVTPASAAAKPVVTLPVLSPSAPDVVAPTGWLNTPPLSPADLKGKVVLYEFWTFGCFNCKNVLPHVKAWHARYAKDGLITLSIHTPEFDYEGKVENIQKFVTDNDITYPVALDPDRDIWHAFSNHYWPNMYLHDQQGQRRYEHIGEGAYDETEDAIRALLGVDPAAPRAEKV